MISMHNASTTFFLEGLSLVLGNNRMFNSCGIVRTLLSAPCRNSVKELVLSKTHDYFGPDQCIDDHVESKYFDNPEVCSNA